MEEQWKVVCSCVALWCGVDSGVELCYVVVWTVVWCDVVWCGVVWTVIVYMCMGKTPGHRRRHHRAGVVGSAWSQTSSRASTTTGRR